MFFLRKAFLLFLNARPNSLNLKKKLGKVQLLTLDQFKKNTTGADLVVQVPCQEGDLILADLFGLGIDLVASRDLGTKDGGQESAF